MPKLKGRQPGFTMSPEHRTKIANSKILSRLIAHVEGDLELSQTQVTAGLGLLKKVMADMHYNENETNITVNTLAETLERIAADGKTVTERR